MGKKSRLKRERKLAGKVSRSSFSPTSSVEIEKRTDKKAEINNWFHDRIEAVRALLCQYDRIDLAIALGVSELWPANAGSPIKHIFAWRVVLELPCDNHSRMSIKSYEEFKSFAELLYGTWPEFPMLEDFSPEADWGQVKVRLGSDFVPMFYGGCIERTPDFVEAFRITYAHIPEAIAHMDLAIALQARIIESIPSLCSGYIGEATSAHVEVPSAEFWIGCRSTLLRIHSDISVWLAKAGSALVTCFDGCDTSRTWGDFGDEVMLGKALPFLAVKSEDAWLPMSVRSSPGVVIDHWANKVVDGISVDTHRSLAKFVAERFTRSVMGPLTPLVDGVTIDDLSISCVISGGAGLYLICTCDHASSERLASAAEDIYIRVWQGGLIHFRSLDGRRLMLSKDGVCGPSADEIRIIIVITQSSTSLGFINVPKGPARLISLADFITIFDSLKDLNELEDFWEFVDGQKNSLSPFSNGAADLFASFKDTHGVLVEGAISPTVIGLDPHWGTSWRFKALANFWTLAPSVFPNDSTGWWLTHGTEGVVVLQSRHHPAVAYSTSVGACTVQVIFDLSESTTKDDAKMIDLFAQLLADCAYRCSDSLLDLSLFQNPHVLFNCRGDPSKFVEVDKPIRPVTAFSNVLTSIEEDRARPGMFHLQIDTRAILSGLNSAKDGSFEVQCLLETIERIHFILGLELPNNFAERFSKRATELARYRLDVVARSVDVPDHIDTVIPSPSEYKLARKQLASDIMSLGLSPGRYELDVAKDKIDIASTRLRLHIENRLASYHRHQLLKALIEQHDALLIAERMKIQRTRQSLAHEVEYDRLDTVEQARKQYGEAARHCRYLLEKTVSSSNNGEGQVTDDVLRELIALVDWYMVLTVASDILHNEVDVVGVLIDDWYIPEIFYSAGSDDRWTEYAREYAKSRLGIGVNSTDVVGGEQAELLSSLNLNHAFMTDLGFDLQSMLTALLVLSQAHRHGFGNELALSYSSAPNLLAQGLVDNIERLELAEAERIVEFLTLSEKGVLRLPGRDVDELDVPYWEHHKRIHRYAIRPLVVDGLALRWGAETASRAMNIWMSTVRDGYLPADFDWPNVKPVVRDIKQSIEKRLELQTEEIFRRHTPFIKRGIDFFRKFRGEGFEDVGDFDVLAYWPDANLLVTVECKYNLPPYTIKDGRRLRDKIFGKKEDDRGGQMSRILGRRQFLEKNRSRMIELLKWPNSGSKPVVNVELYVSRDVFYWMIHPPFPVPTQFVRVDTLDSWIRTELHTLCQNG